MYLLNLSTCQPQAHMVVFCKAGQFDWHEGQIFLGCLLCSFNSEMHTSDETGL